MKRKGFTLIELLIASAILSMVLLIATATFASTANYNGKLREMRRASQDARKIATYISDDIRMANGSAVIDVAGTSVSCGEVTFLDCSSNSCAPSSRFSSPRVAASYDDSSAAEALLIIQEDEDLAVVYRSFLTSEGSRVQRIEMSLSPSLQLLVDDTDSVLSNSHMDTGVRFSGFASEKRDRRIHPFVKLNIRSRTAGNFDQIRPGMKAEFNLSTSVTTRDFNR